MKVTWILVALTAAAAGDAPDWYQNNLFYHIYPRSFKDSDGDGIGDLKGIADKVDYFKDAGIGAVSLSPIYKSSNVDFGYDVTNFKDVDSTLGTLEDFDNLHEKLKEHGIKLVLDFVPNHSSHESEWFQKSLHRIEPYTDYYVWADPKFDDKGVRIPPNNWLSAFGGSAWEYRDERQQYYLHSFLKEQPDFNYRSDNVKEEIKKAFKFWLDKGVDGFRFSGVPYLFEDAELRDEPLSGYIGAHPDEADYLNHIYTQNLPETYDLIHEWRKILEEKKAEDGETRLLIVDAKSPLDKALAYYGTEEKPGCHFPLNLNLITDLHKESSAHEFEAAVRKFVDHSPKGIFANWLIGNHDHHRVATRFGPELVDGLNALALLLPGAAVTYNGEELGLEDTPISFQDTVDPLGIRAGPLKYGLFSRDPERTPFQWDDSINAGFSTSGHTWLPVNPNYKELNLEAQKEAIFSHYKVYKRLVELRKEPAIERGLLKSYAASDKVFAFSRVLSGSSPYVVAINLGGEKEAVKLDGLSDIPENLAVDVASINSERKIGSIVSKSDLTLYPKETLVLTDASHYPFHEEHEGLPIYPGLHSDY